MREIEIKLRVKNLQDIEEKLNKRGCILSSPISQHDVIYTFGDSNDIWQRSKEGDVAMRIRRLDDGAEFNLKQQKSNEMDNLEYETRIENPEAVHNILITLGYVPHVEVKKTRRKGKLGEYEISLDEVEKLGNFVELEKLTSDNTDPNKTREELSQVLESLGLSLKDEETRGYDTQIYQLSKVLGEETMTKRKTKTQ